MLILLRFENTVVKRELDHQDRRPRPVLMEIFAKAKASEEI